MTKVIILGAKETKPKKDIEFTGEYGDDCKLMDDYAEYKPNEFKHVEIVCFNYRQSDHDLMFGYDDDRHSGILFIGQYNDGTV